MNMDRLVGTLKRHEGRVIEYIQVNRTDRRIMHMPYKDSVGITTIGYGHNLEAKGINDRMAEQLLVSDIAYAIMDAEDYEWWDNLDNVRAEVVVNMIFNLGAGGFAGFARMRKALAQADYETAADEMMDSLWYRQVGDRAVELVKWMREGIIV